MSSFKCFLQQSRSKRSNDTIPNTIFHSTCGKQRRTQVLTSLDMYRAEFLLRTTINTYSASHTELFVCLNYSPLMRIIYGSQRQDTPRNTPHNGVHINKHTNQHAKAHSCCVIILHLHLSAKSFPCAKAIY